MKHVILAEKPNQALKYAEALGTFKKKDGYFEVTTNILEGDVIVTWCIGHLIQLADMEDYDSSLKAWKKETLPFIPKRMKYKVSPYTSQQFYKIEGLCESLTSQDVFIIATDPDREGEVIARYVMNQIPNIKNRDITIKRLWANTQEPEGLRTSFQSLKTGAETYPYYLEAQARGVADWLVGINMTRLTSITMQNMGINVGVFSVGRVQTPTLFMVYTRNKAIESFESKPFYELFAIDETSNPLCRFKYDGRFESKETYDAFKEEHDLKDEMTGQIDKVEVKEKQTPAPKLFKLGGIQKVANQKWGYTLDETLSIVQSLYDKGFLSYPRTDSDLITTSEFKYLKERISDYANIVDIQENFTNLEPRKRFVDSDKVLEHYAIVPTKTIPTLKDLSAFSSAQQNIYREVVIRTLGMFQPDFVYDETKVTLRCQDVIFKARGTITKDKGWKQYQNTEEKETDVQVIPSYQEKQTIQVKLENKEGRTKPPVYLTEATLGGEGGLMETCSNGLDDEILKKDLKNVSGIGTPATRGNIVKGLIDKGYMEVRKKKLYITEKGNMLCEALKNSQLASVEMTAHWEHELKTISEIGKKDVQDKFLEKIKVSLKEEVNNFDQQIKTSVSGSSLESLQKSQMIGKCPKCRQGHLLKRKSKKGQPFYTCDSSTCEYILFGVISGKTLSETIIQSLLETHKSKVIKGFKSKAGKKFDAKLKLNEEYKIVFDFEKK